jgi:hypothetical protein
VAQKAPGISDRDGLKSRPIASTKASRLLVPLFLSSPLSFENASSMGLKYGLSKVAGKGVRSLASR